MQILNCFKCCATQAPEEAPRAAAPSQALAPAHDGADPPRRPRDAVTLWHAHDDKGAVPAAAQGRRGPPLLPPPQAAELALPGLTEDVTLHAASFLSLRELASLSQALGQRKGVPAAALVPALEAFVEEHPNRIEWVVRHFPRLVNERMAELACRDDYDAYPVLPQRLRDNPRIIQITVSRHGTAVKHLDGKQITRALALDAMCREGALCNLPYPLSHDLGLVEAALGADEGYHNLGIIDPDCGIGYPWRGGRLSYHPDFRERHAYPPLSPKCWQAALVSALRRDRCWALIDPDYPRVLALVPPDMREACAQAALALLETQHDELVPRHSDPYDPKRPGALVVPRIESASYRHLYENARVRVVGMQWGQAVCRNERPIDPRHQIGVVLGKDTFRVPLRGLRSIEPAPQPVDQARRVDAPRSRPVRLPALALWLEDNEHRASPDADDSLREQDFIRAAADAADRKAGAPDAVAAPLERKAGSPPSLDDLCDPAHCAFVDGLQDQSKAAGFEVLGRVQGREDRVLCRTLRGALRGASPEWACEAPAGDRSRAHYYEVPLSRLQWAPKHPPG